MGALLGFSTGVISTPLAAAILIKVFCTKKSITIKMAKTNARAANIILLVILPELDAAAAAPGAATAATGAGGI